MDAGLGRWAAHDADGLAWAFAGAGVGLSALAPDGQTTQVADSAIALDTLQTLEVHADFAAEIAFDDIFAVLDGVNNLRELLLGQVLGANGGIDIGLGEDIARVAGPDAVDIAQRDVNALVRGNFDADDTCHKSGVLLTLALFVAGVGADNTNNAFATDDLAVFAKLFN